MMNMAKDLQFERAAELRDKIESLKGAYTGRGSDLCQRIKLL